jgi:hypothetical protein
MNSNNNKGKKQMLSHHKQEIERFRKQRITEQQADQEMEMKVLGTE